MNEPTHTQIRSTTVLPARREDIDKIRGLEITIVTTDKTDEESRELLELFGMPFERV